MNTETAPLAGLRVLEICAHAALPLGGRTLAELGAEVIRIDPAEGGTETTPRTAAELLAAHPAPAAGSRSPVRLRQPGQATPN